MAASRQNTATTTLPIHVSADSSTAVQGTSSASQNNSSSSNPSTNPSHPSRPLSTQPPTNTTIPSLYQDLIITAVATTNIKNVAFHIKILNPPLEPKDWKTMTLAERLEATTDLPLGGFEGYNWKVESEVAGMSTWPVKR